MKITVQRRWETSKSVCGEMFVDGQHESYTLEPARMNPVNVGHPCIPAGEYGITFSVSPHLGYRTPELVNVPNRSDIRIHIGNYPKNSLGCILVGENHVTDAVGNSHSTFESLMTLLNTATDPITIIVTDPIPS